MKVCSFCVLHGIISGICCLDVDSTDNLSEVHDDSKNPPTPERQLQHRANATVHVCWHRNTSVGANDYRSALEVMHAKNKFTSLLREQ